VSNSRKCRACSRWYQVEKARNSGRLRNSPPTIAWKPFCGVWATACKENHHKKRRIGEDTQGGESLDDAHANLRGSYNMGEILASRWTLGKAGMRLRVMETGPLCLSQVTMPLSLFKTASFWRPCPPQKIRMR